MNRFKKSNPWKYVFLTLVVCLSAVLGLYQVFGLSQDTPAPAAGQAAVNLRTIDVSGSAEVLVAPDEVDITVGIETRNPDFKKAETENEDTAKKFIKLTGQYGIAQKDVQSDYIRSFAVYKYQNYTETNKVDYYTVQKRIVVKLKDISRFEAFTSDLMDDGKVSIQNIEFRASELGKYRDEARKLAIRAARDKAELLTGELGGGISKPVTISEEQLESQAWYGSWWGSLWYGYGGQANLSALSNVSVNYQNGPVPAGGQGSGSQDSSISIGQIRVTAKIGVVFELK